ncbi:Cytosolic enolase [Arachis hypogaea]|nr:Cytosolic enolase [Arachis hypogaea]
MVFGDDLLMSNAKHIERAVLECACNPLLLKLCKEGNQYCNASKWKMDISSKSSQRQI